jgi:hypothetical protein
MANYAVSDVARVLRERDWQDWDELLGWLRDEPVDTPGGLSATDRSELLRDFTRLRDEGQPLLKQAGELYRAALPGGA